MRESAPETAGKAPSRRPRAITKAEGLARLTARWEEQSLRFPSLRIDVPLSLYIEVNLRRVAKLGLLSGYQVRG